MRILSVCLNPTFQVTMQFSSFTLGEVNRCSDHYLDASGKGMNAARILSQLGEESVLLTHLGGTRKQEMLDLCSKDKVEILWADSNSEIRTCTTILENGRMTELVQEPYAVDAGTEQPIRSLFSQAVGSCDGVIITGTRAPGYHTNLYADFVAEAKLQGKFVLLDLKGADLLACLPYRVDMIKPNLSEAAHTFLGLKVGEQEDTTSLERRIRPILADLQRQYGTTVVLSRGNRETWVQGPSFFTVPVQQVEALNPIGCGDALGAALTRELIMGTNLQQAAQRATIVATMNAKSIHPGSIV
ncbi:1-phosphofructokinase family hexose kinase [Sphaerochaeta sp.]|uniref:1-phosphofructokinase family hexose kinase n=1 Tax=Sphaerochaeta sp. TaxID=1972642 RepID=UPI002FCA61D4